MNFQFIIPSKNSDLLNSEGDNYYVKQVYDPCEIPLKLQACGQHVHLDAFYIFDHFDTYFSVIENAENVTMNILLRSFDLLFLTAGKLEQTISDFLNMGYEKNSHDRNSHLNLVKMTLFAFIGTVHAIDNVINKAQYRDVQFRKNKKSDIEGFGGQIWNEKRFNFLNLLFSIIQLPLQKLWIPPIAEENFVNMFCDVCYRTLELSCAKDVKIYSTVFQILGTAIKAYNHALMFPVRVLEILQSKKAENAITPISKGLYILYDEFGIQSIFSVVIKDIISNIKYNSSDTQTVKNISVFLHQLATTASKLIIPNLSTLADELLSFESHTLRNCILQIIGDVILTELTSEELSDDLKETRDEFLEDLLNHMEDVHANVRSKVLQIWANMQERNAVPLAFQHKVLSNAIERLEDKTIPVRKNAVNLVKSFLENNPFAAKLTIVELMKQLENENAKVDKLRSLMAKELQKAAELDKKWDKIASELSPVLKEILEQDFGNLTLTSQENFDDLISEVSTLLIENRYKEAIILVLQADEVAESGQLRRQLEFDDLCLYITTLLKSYLFLSHGYKDINEELATQENAVKFLEDSIEFSKIITKAVPKIQEMLMSKSHTDVFEAVDFFVTAYLFGIKGTETGMKNMLYLVWSGDKEKRDAVTNAYKKIFFRTDLQGRAHAIKVVKNLSSFIEDLTYGQYSALEVLIKEWVESNDIDVQVIQVLFERFTLKLEHTSENESRLALQLLIATSSTKASVTTANIVVIETIALGDRGLKDPRIYSGCLHLLLNSIPSHLASKFYKRYEFGHILIENIINSFKKFLFSLKIMDFDTVATKTIDFFYCLCQTPDVICQNLLINIHRNIKEIAEKKQCTTPTLPLSKKNEISLQHSIGREKNLPTILLARFIFVAGYITMKEMIFLDIDVYNNMKFREELKEMKNNLKKKVHKRRTIHLDMSASESLKRLSGTAAEPQQEPDEDLVGAIAEDNIAELINYICEEDLLFSINGLLKKIVPIVIEICKHPSEYDNGILQQASILCLIRLMTVSSKFCDKYMPFIMNVLQKNDNTKIKCNIIIGLSDLTFRFPNIIEPWTSYIFATLYDTNDEIRLTAVKMISHLVLNEMIRVKGQISDLAVRIVDENKHIRYITQQFFKELSNKPNILYNVLPDIISKLSDKNLNLEEGKYRIIMRYILSLIQKDRQVESLVEKLCLRFKITYEERQWRDIAYCLSLLSYSEKSMKKLIDNIQYFRDKIQVDEVHQSFKKIITNASKQAKPELKVAVIEFEKRLTECLQVDDNVFNDNDQKDTRANYNLGTVLNQPTLASSMSSKNCRDAEEKIICGNREKQKKQNCSLKSSSTSSSDDELYHHNKKQKQVRIVQSIRELESSNNTTNLIPKKKKKKKL